MSAIKQAAIYALAIAWFAAVGGALCLVFAPSFVADCLRGKWRRS